MNRIKSIDGLRAISIIMVLLWHSTPTLPTYLTDNVLFKYISNGSLGVKFFFVISGYLITKLLLAEEQKTGNINIKNFYFRRAFRIFPVFYLYILVILILKWFFIPDIFSSYYYILFAGLYLWNYKHLFTYPIIPNDKGYWFLGHFWTLSMEEQFYLLWPITFKKTSKKLLIKIVSIIVLTMPLLRVATYFLMPNSRGQIGMMLQTGGDTILVGCLGALLENKILANAKINYLLKSNQFVGFSFFILFVVSATLAEKFRGMYTLLIGNSLGNFIILFILLWSIHVPSLMSRVLNSKVFVHIGILSYSLYIWQQLFLTNLINSWTNQFPQNLVLVVLVAICSYNLVEKPLLTFKNRFKEKPTPKVLSS